MGEEVEIVSNKEHNKRVLTDLQNKITEAQNHYCADSVTAVRRAMADTWFKSQRPEFPKLFLEALAERGWVIVQESSL